MSIKNEQVSYKIFSYTLTIFAFNAFTLFFLYYSICLTKLHKCLFYIVINWHLQMYYEKIRHFYLSLISQIQSLITPMLHLYIIFHFEFIHACLLTTINGAFKNITISVSLTTCDFVKIV